MISDYLNKKINFEYSKISIKITKQIYTSTTSRIYLCSDLNNVSKTYCLKINSALCHDKIICNSINYEIVTLLGLKNNPHIVNIIDYCSQEVNGTLIYFVLLEYCGNGSLAETIDNLSKENNSFSEHQIWNIIYQLCQGLDSIHRNKISHRDVRAENILITIDGTYKICDFKSATNKIYGNVNNSNRNEIIFDISRNTSQSIRAPEQSDLYTGYPINEKVDIWALGVLLYRLLFENQLFLSSSKIKCLSKESLELTQEMINYYSPDIISLLYKMLLPDPRSRISSLDILKIIETKKESLLGNKNSPIIKKPFSIKNSVSDATIKIFKRHSTQFWIIKLVNEDLASHPKLKYIKLLVNKAWTKKFKISKFFNAVSTRPIHYYSIVALKALYTIHNYIFFGPKESAITENFNITEFLTFLSDVWSSRYSNGNYDKDEMLKNSHVTKFIVSYSEFLKLKIIYYKKYGYVDNNYSIENLLVNRNFDFSLLIEKTFVSETISLFSLLYQKIIQVPISITNISKTLDCILQIFNEEMVNLFRLIFFLLIGYKNKMSSINFNEVKVFDSQFIEITNKSKEYTEKLKKFRVEINSKNFFIDYLGDNINFNLYIEYINSLNENLKFFPNKEFNIQKFFSSKDIIGIKLPKNIGNLINKNMFFNNVNDPSDKNILINQHMNNTMNNLEKKSDIKITANNFNMKNNTNFEFSEEKFLNSKTIFDFESDKNSPTIKIDTKNNKIQKFNNDLSNNLFDLNCFKNTCENKKETTLNKNSEDSLSNLNTNILNLLNDIFESNKLCDNDKNYKNQSNNNKLIDLNVVNFKNSSNDDTEPTHSNNFEYRINSNINKNKTEFKPIVKDNSSRDILNFNDNFINDQSNNRNRNEDNPYTFVNNIQNAYNYNQNNFNNNFDKQILFNQIYYNNNNNQDKIWSDQRSNHIQNGHQYFMGGNINMVGKTNYSGLNYNNFNYCNNQNINDNYYNKTFYNDPIGFNINIPNDRQQMVFKNCDTQQEHRNNNSNNFNNSSKDYYYRETNQIFTNPTNEDYESVNSHLPQMSIINIQNNYNDIKVYKEVNIETLANDFLKEEFSKKNLQWLISSKDLNYGKQIGFGGSSEVFRADYRGTEVAVKKLKILEVKEENLKEFKREVSSLIMLRHPNLVLFMGAIAEKDNICIVTEYCAGGTLFNILHQKKDLIITWELRLRLLIEIAVGMNFLHTNSPPIIHRDLKSLNILLTEKIEKPSDNTRLKISDFGLSKIIGTFDYNFEQMTGQLGTCHWMAPEVIENKHYTIKADVFSYGIIIWEILTRKTPYQDMSQQQISFYVTLKKGRPDKSFIPSNTPPALIKLMESCWDVEPNNRPSFEEIISFLKKIKL